MLLLFSMKEVYQGLDAILTEDNALTEPARYACLTPSHHWRSQLLLKSASCYNVSQEEAMPVALAIELLHNSSLILDDLPSQDNATERRGQPCLHVKYGIATADLCSHYLIAQAIEVITQSKINPDQQRKILGEIAITASSLLNGQQKDLQSASDLEEKLKEYSLKTGSLFAAASYLGASLGYPPKDHLTHLRSFGNNLGIAYQMKDDAKDTGEKKITPAYLVGGEEARKLFRRFKENAREDLRRIDRKLNPLELFIEEFLQEGNHAISLTSYLGRTLTLQGSRGSKTIILDALGYNGETLVAILGHDERDCYHLPLDNKPDWTGFVVQEIRNGKHVLLTPGTRFRTIDRVCKKVNEYLRMLPHYRFIVAQ